MHWWGKNQVAEKCRSAIRTTFETDLRNDALMPSQQNGWFYHCWLIVRLVTCDWFARKVTVQGCVDISRTLNRDTAWNSS